MILELEHQDGVVVIRWRDDENRFRRDSIDRWHEVSDELEQQDGPLAVVVAAEGKIFSNGLDLEWFGRHPDEAGGVIEDVHRLFGRMLLFPAYVVFAITGHAFAGGAMLSCAGDLRVMRSDRGYWCLPEVDLGFPMTAPMARVVTARLPWPAAQEAILTGRRYTADEAVAVGIIDEVAVEDAVVSRAVELAAPMAVKDRSVIAAHKRLLFGDAAAACGWVAAES
jgi:enoyl-CoA hydratase/carnithine racemase